MKTTVPMKAFEVGKNIATSEGKVVFQNDLMQLIWYKPKRAKYEVPILICPPWINKYYILDLSEHNSFVKWLIDNGMQVFMISWINPDKSLANKNFEDYLQDGIIAAVNYISKYYTKINTIGYCLGGTLLATSLAYFKAKNNNIIGSATMLTTFLDFKNPGDMGFFLTKDAYKSIENLLDTNGILDGGYMSQIFNILRSKEMIWSYFVNNYLLGKTPTPFDILYWNSDSTNLPSAMHKFYLKNMYIENNLRKSGGINLLGVPIDLSLITNPIFMFATKEDHIVPWQSAFDSAKLFSGMTQFCLGASGHVAGVINPPHKNKYSFWVNNALNDRLQAQDWLDIAQEQSGSWWNYWLEWQKSFSGQLLDCAQYEQIDKFIEYAPGSYVQKRIVNN